MFALNCLKFRLKPSLSPNPWFEKTTTTADQSFNRDEYQFEITFSLWTTYFVTSRILIIKTNEDFTPALTMTHIKILNWISTEEQLNLCSSWIWEMKNCNPQENIKKLEGAILTHWKLQRKKDIRDWDLIPLFRLQLGKTWSTFSW